MREADDVVGEDFGTALAEAQDGLQNIQRLLMAMAMMRYPHPRRLNRELRSLRRDLGSAAVQVNVITEDSQVTVAADPESFAHATVPSRQSLCVLTAGTGIPMQVSDIRVDHLTRGHDARMWGSWASVPLVVGGVCAGALCALEQVARVWTDREQERMTRTAVLIGSAVDAWALTQA